MHGRVAKELIAEQAVPSAFKRLYNQRESAAKSCEIADVLSSREM